MAFMTAVICSRRPIAPPNTCPCCWAMVPSWKWPKASRCRCCPPLPMLPSKRAFWKLWDRRWNEIVTQLDTDVKTLDDERTFQPEAMDMRGAVASLPEAERA